MTGPVDPDRDQLIEVAGRQADACCSVPHDAPKLPDWAEEWLPGRCGCGARLVRPPCYCGGPHMACSMSGVETDKCPRTRLIASYIADLARGGSTDEERNDEQ